MSGVQSERGVEGDKLFVPDSRWNYSSDRPKRDRLGGREKNQHMLSSQDLALTAVGLDL